MKLAQITPLDAHALLMDDWLFDRVSDDGVDRSTYQLPQDHVYIGVFDPSLIGFFWLHHDTSSALNIHINMMEQCKGKGADAAKLFLSEFKKNARDDLNKLICKIPVIYSDVYHFAKKLGFQDEGLDRKSIKKGGKVIDRHILGITREEITWAQ